MVKELDDGETPSSLLDCDPSGDVGDPPDSSFDAAVRAAADRQGVRRPRARSTLVTTSASPAAVDVCSLDGDFARCSTRWRRWSPMRVSARRALAHDDARAAPRGRAGGRRRPSTRRRPGPVAAATRWLLSVVWVDAPSHAGRPTPTLPGLLQLTAAGVPVAVVRRGADLAAAPSTCPPVAHAHG
jgi:hypothetical protein